MGAAPQSGDRWLARAVEHLLPDWSPDETPIRRPTVRGTPDEHHPDPRFAATEWRDAGGLVSLRMMVEGGPGRPGLWIEQTYSPEQCIQVVAAILSTPAVQEAAGPLLAALSGATVPETETEIGQGRPVASEEEPAPREVVDLATATREVEEALAEIGRKHADVIRETVARIESLAPRGDRSDRRSDLTSAMTKALEEVCYAEVVERLGIPEPEEDQQVDHPLAAKAYEWEASLPDTDEMGVTLMIREMGVEKALGRIGEILGPRPGKSNKR